MSEPIGEMWTVLIAVPADGQVLVAQQVEWMVPPDGIDPVEYAEDRLRMLLAGMDPKCDGETLGALAPGAVVRCTVRRGDQLLADVEQTTGKQE